MAWKYRGQCRGIVMKGLLVALPRRFHGNRRGTIVVWKYCGCILYSVVGPSWEGMLEIHSSGMGAPFFLAKTAT